MPSIFPGYFDFAFGVEPGGIVTSAQMVRMARRINQGILSGVGDMHWRTIATAYSAVRNLRIGSGSLVANENEWFELYGLYKETLTNWPTADPGEPEGLNKVGCPIATYFFGNNGLPLEGEATRHNDEVPLRESIGAPPPSTDLEVWDLGKDQRGAVDVADTTDLSKAPAMRVARIMGDFNTAANAAAPLSTKHTTPGGKITQISDVYSREKGEQWRTMETAFVSEFSGTEDERQDDPRWFPKDLTVAYQEMLSRQYLLAPARGQAVGSLGDISAIYPLFEWDDLAAAETYGEYESSPGSFVSSWANATGFSFTGVIVVGSNLTGDKTVDFEIDGAVFQSLTVTVAKPQAMVWFPQDTKKGTLKVKLRTALTGSEDIFAEAAELLDHKPDLVDLMLYIRMKTARSSSPSIYRGKIISEAKELSNEYFQDGMVLNGVSATVPNEDKIAEYAPYQAFRDFLIANHRIMERERLVGYKIVNGKSVFIFDRRGRGDSNADQFQDLAPNVNAVTKVKHNCEYEVREDGGTASGYIEYNGSQYSEGDSFFGDENVHDFSTSNATHLAVFEKSHLIDPDEVPARGWSSEWVMSIGGQTLYDNSGSGTYKASAYHDPIGTLHDRCHTFSSALVAPNADAKAEAFNKYSNGGPEQGILQRAETPPGHRYAGGDVPYAAGAAALVNPLIEAADDPATVADCRDSLFTDFTPGGTPVSDLTDADCVGIAQHYESCQVYKAPYLIEAIDDATDPNRVMVTLRGRLNHSDSAPDTLDDTGTSRATYLAADTGPRTDENTVVGLLRKQNDGVDDPERIGDISPNALDAIAGGDWNPSNIDGGAYCRFFFQRLVPEVYNDADNTVENDEDTRTWAWMFQYMEWIIRASVGGFVDKTRINNTLTYHAGPPSYCDNQDSMDLTMPRCFELIGQTGQDSFPLRQSTDKRGVGVLPNTEMYAHAYTEMAQVLNLLNIARLDTPVYLVSKLLTYWDLHSFPIEYKEGFAIVRSAGWIQPTTLRTDPDVFFQETLPFGEAATAYMTILNDETDGNDKVLMFYQEIHFFVQIHPRIQLALTPQLRGYLSSLGLAVPRVYQPPIDKTVRIDREPLPEDDDVTDFTTLLDVATPSERCEVGQSGIVRPNVPSSSPIAVDLIGVTPSSSSGDADPSSVTSMGINTTGEAYVQIPLQP